MRGRQSRCSTVIAETANSPVALLSLPVSSSWYPTQRSPVRRRRTQFVLAAVVSRLAAFAAIVAFLYSRVANRWQVVNPSPFLHLMRMSKAESIDAAIALYPASFGCT